MILNTSILVHFRGKIVLFTSLQLQFLVILQIQKSTSASEFISNSSIDRKLIGNYFENHLADFMCVKKCMFPSFQILGFSVFMNTFTFNTLSIFLIILKLLSNIFKAGLLLI